MAYKSLAISAVLAAIFVQLASADSCVQCDSRESAACANQSLHLQPTECANTSAFGCFSRIVDGHTVRGCLGALSNPDECAASPLCNSCFNVNNAQGCNNQQYPELRLFCHQCNGTLESGCAAEQTDVPRMCNVYSDSNQCFIRRTNTTIERGCMTAHNNGCSNPAHCFICDGHGCNLNVHNDTQIPLAPSSAAQNAMSAVLAALAVALLALVAV